MIVFRKIVITLILATDLQMHFPMLTEYRFQMEDLGKTLEDEDFRLHTLEICLKCGDFGHSAKELSIHKEWTQLIVLEFFAQGDKEMALGLPISPLCDRGSVLVPTSQLGFLTVMVRPLFLIWDEFLRKNGDWRDDLNASNVFSEQINTNIRYWEYEEKQEEDTGKHFQVALRSAPLLVA